MSKTMKWREFAQSRHDMHDLYIISLVKKSEDTFTPLGKTKLMERSEGEILILVRLAIKAGRHDDYPIGGIFIVTNCSEYCFVDLKHDSVRHDVGSGNIAEWPFYYQAKDRLNIIVDQSDKEKIKKSVDAWLEENETE